MSADCREYFARISEYLDGELDESVCRKIEEHLQDCPQCRDCLDTLKRTIRLCQATGRKGMPPETRQRLRESLKDCLERQET
jgi:predicted anti-sigma-YlaC factor YlaD